LGADTEGQVPLGPWKEWKELAHLGTKDKSVLIRHTWQRLGIRQTVKDEVVFAPDPGQMSSDSIPSSLNC
jgi:hypothetical protein